jgi:hypothetical protein
VKTYRGHRDEHACAVVTVTEAEGAVQWTGELDPGPSLLVRALSPTGFEWGYCGSGPAQLALAVLLDATGSADWAERHYQAFKWDVVAGWPQDAWQFTTAEVLAWLARQVPAYAPAEGGVS